MSTGTGALQLFSELFYRPPLRHTCGANLEAVMAKNVAAIKRNNRKIHARKFLATPRAKPCLNGRRQKRRN